MNSVTLIPDEYSKKMRELGNTNGTSLAEQRKFKICGFAFCLYIFLRAYLQCLR